jgi:hypothetical protein
MALVLEPYQHRIETGGRLCRSFMGTGYQLNATTRAGLLHSLCRRSPERISQFPQSCPRVLRPQASDVDTRVFLVGTLGRCLWFALLQAIPPVYVCSTDGPMLGTRCGMLVA